MTELRFDDPCVLFALSREAGAFLREFRAHQRFPEAPCWARFCGPAWLTLLVLQTGIGADRTAAALTWLLQAPLLGNVPYRPRVVLSAGFAGALREGLRAGDVVLATEIVDAQGSRWPATWPGELPAGEWRPPLRRGRLLTMPHLVGDPKEKQRLGQTQDAWAVDMESAIVAQACTRAGIPFGCLRVVTDDVHTALASDLIALLSRQRASPFRLLAALPRRPSLIRDLARLTRVTRHAAHQLALALGEVLTLTLPGGREL
ncbi:MAG: hypothetical protein ACK4RK_12685 [Gemmataceae bacterium]